MTAGSAWGLWSKVDVAGPSDCWPWLGRRRIILAGIVLILAVLLYAFLVVSREYRA